MKKKVKAEYKFLKKEYSYVFGMMIFFSSTFFLVFDYIINKKLSNYYFETLELQTYTLLGVFFVFIMIVMFFLPSKTKIKFIFFKTIFISSIFMAVLIFLTLYDIAYNVIIDEVSKAGKENYVKIIYTIGVTIVSLFIVQFVIHRRKNKLKKKNR